MNKRIFHIVFFLLAFLSSKAQDTIVKRDGERIVARVTEVNPHDIRYKRNDNPDGPVYRLEKEQINYVIYFNGSKDLFDTYKPPRSANETTDFTIQTAGKYYYFKSFKITEPDMHAVVKRIKDPSLNAMIKSVENKKFIQDLGFIVSVPVLISGIYIYGKNSPMRSRRGGPQTSSSAQQTGQKIGISMIIGALACDLVSVSLVFDRRRHNHLVVNAYNKKITLVDH